MLGNWSVVFSSFIFCPKKEEKKKEEGKKGVQKMATLAAARADNFFYPPGFDPSKGQGLNKVSPKK